MGYRPKIIEINLIIIIIIIITPSISTTRSSPLHFADTLHLKMEALIEILRLPLKAVVLLPIGKFVVEFHILYLGMIMGVKITIIVIMINRFEKFLKEVGMQTWTSM